MLASRALARSMELACHRPPAGVLIFRQFSSFASDQAVRPSSSDAGGATRTTSQLGDFPDRAAIELRIVMLLSGRAAEAMILAPRRPAPGVPPTAILARQRPLPPGSTGGGVLAIVFPSSARSPP